ncbi:MAG: hypothetical protein P8Q14_02690, partial [Vicingaceae bacterium]|nr:hypothetical protein [Vicingaceae bacterium]
TVSNIFGILGGILLCLGVLFKIMHWPFASILMNSGGGLLILVFLPIYIYNSIKTKQLKTSTIVPLIVAVAGFSLMFSLVRLQSSQNVRTSRGNYHNNINQNIASTLMLNEQLAGELNNDTSINIKVINEIAITINNKSNELCSMFIQSKLSEYSPEDIKHKEQNDFENFSITLGELNVMQNDKNGLPQLIKLVESYKASYYNLTGSQPEILLNNNFEYYLNKENKVFAFRFVLRDINSLNLQLQQIHTGLLQYYKGKVS